MAPSGDYSSGQQDIISRLNNNARRIRQLEETTRNLQEQVKSLEDRLNKQRKEVTQNRSDIKTETKDLWEEVDNLQAELKNLQRKSRKMVTRREFSEIEDYMDLMSPVTSAFMTKNEVEELVETKLEQQGAQSDEV